MKSLIKIILLCALAINIESIAATNQQATFTSSSVIASSCQIAATDITIGDITATSSSSGRTFGSGTLNVTCSNSLAYRLYMGNGNNYSAGTPNLKGAANGQLISYCMRSSTASIDNSCVTSYWGGDVTHSVAGTGTGANQAITMYAITNKGYYIPDTYSDTMTVSVNF